MSKEEQDNELNTNKALHIADVSSSTITTSKFKFIMPLHMTWKPKEDITTYELAMCLPYLLRHTPVMPYEVNKDEPHMRHFEIHDPN